MGVKIKFNKNFDKFKKDPMAFAEQFPCPECKTMSKKVSENMFHCPQCNRDFSLNVTYLNRSNSKETLTVDDSK